jgi:hypothetical protein
MLPSQEMRQDIYPDSFTEEDKVNFDILVAEAKRIFPRYEEWMIKIAVIAHINTEKGLTIPKSKEEIEELKNQYDLSGNRLYETPVDENVEIKHKEIIYVE